MIILFAVMLAVGLLASLALGSACMIGQALVESQAVPGEIDNVDGYPFSGASWQPAVAKVRS